MLKLSETLQIDNDDAILRIGRALSSATRLKVLRLLLQGEKDVTRVARHLGGTEANASAQIKILYEAGLLDCRYEPGQHGLKKISKTKVRRVILDLE
ncbi:MAG: transcriptional regulator [Candidatus Thorarchaeota archaeon]|nr:MAG: transcriptional regulator [Candidatus Thorarchaeota archaeon]